MKSARIHDISGSSGTAGKVDVGGDCSLDPVLVGATALVVHKMVPLQRLPVEVSRLRHVAVYDSIMIRATPSLNWM
jgi:hypothetical protein